MDGASTASSVTIECDKGRYHTLTRPAPETPMTTDLSNTEQLPASLFTPTPQAAQHIANHESPRKTKLYARRQEEISLDEVERIAI